MQYSIAKFYFNITTILYKLNHYRNDNWPISPAVMITKLLPRIVKGAGQEYIFTRAPIPPCQFMAKVEIELWTS